MKFFRTHNLMRIIIDANGTMVFSVDLVNELHLVAHSNRPGYSDYSKEDINKLVSSLD